MVVKKGGGILIVVDFVNYKIIEIVFIICSYCGYKFVFFLLFSFGGVILCEMLNVFEGYDLKSMGFNFVVYIYMLIEVMCYVYMDCNMFFGDFEFVKNLIDCLLSKSYVVDICK